MPVVRRVRREGDDSTPWSGWPDPRTRRSQCISTQPGSGKRSETGCTHCWATMVDARRGRCPTWRGSALRPHASRQSGAQHAALVVATSQPARY
jgi:hypothetical protein